MPFHGTLSRGLTLVALSAAGLTAACTQTEETVALANPAAVYCEEVGGQHVIRDGKGGQVGVCVLPDGSEVDAWDYFRANNPA